MRYAGSPADVIVQKLFTVLSVHLLMSENSCLQRGQSTCLSHEGAIYNPAHCSLAYVMMMQLFIILSSAMFTY